MRGKGNRKSSGLVLVILIMMVFLSVCKKPERIIAFITLETRVEDISYNTASLRGEIIDPGSQPVDEYGIVYSTDPNPRIGNGTAKAAGSSLKKGEFSISVTGLNKNTKYYFRAYVIIDDVERHADDIYSFTTKDTQVPVVTAGTVSNISRTSASLAGEVTSDGGEAGTIRGLCWGSAANPTIENCIDTTINGSGSGQFTGVMNGLVAGERYYARVYARNSKGTRYNDTDVIFKTHDLPEVTTASITGVTTSGAVSGGNVVDDGEVEVTARGVCWSTNPGPTTALTTKTVDGAGKGVFVSNITGLSSGTTYYVRAYATNQYGTTYGNELSFITQSSTITDFDGNIYNIIRIGTQEWFQSNLKTERYNNGQQIQVESTIPGWSAIDYSVMNWYNDDPSNKATYGGLYNWWAATDARNICPAGWYVPGEEDWNTLINYLGGISVAGGKLKESGTEYWTAPNTGATNESGFTARPGGYRSYDGSDNRIGADGFWWSTDLEPNTGQGYYRSLQYDLQSVVKVWYSKTGCFSIRCIKGVKPIPNTVPATSTGSTGTTLNGKVNPNGAATTVTFEYGTTTSYTSSITADQSPISGTTPVSVTANISGLTTGTTYHYRVKAVNSWGTVYSEDLTFITLVPPTIPSTSVSNITTNTALLAGVVNPNNSSTTVTFEYGTSTSYGQSVVADQSPASGGSSTSVTAAISGLTPGTLYHFRIKAQSVAGLIYSNDNTFTTPASSVPAVTTTAISSVTSSSAASGGSISSDGGFAITAKGVCWSTTANPTTADQKTTDGTGTASFTSSITGLAPGTTYHVRAYATNSSGTGYGTDLTFTTAAALPTVTTSAVSSVTNISATCGGNVTNSGGATVIIKGVCWSTSPDPTTADPKSNDGSGTGAFSSSITGLSAGTTYYVRAYATNSAGTAYGAQVSFTTINPATTIFSIIGSETGWSTDVDLTLTGTSNTISTYRLASRLFVQGELFKIRKNHDWATNYGYDNLVITGEAANFRESTDNVEVISDRTYEVLLDVNWLTGGLTLNMNNLTPALSTTAASSISFLTAQTGGNVTNQGSSSVTAKGVCWSTGPKPSVSGPKTYDGTGTGSFVSSLSGLIPDTTYYIRAYATNSSGTSYGNELTFTTLSQVADIDGNTYNVLLIGNQLWTKENLRTTKYNDGTSISLITSNSSWQSNTSGAYCFYNNDAATYKNIYGALYTWYAASSGKLCPTGWRVPSNSDFVTLRDFLGGTSVAGGQLKATGTIYWQSPNTGATNNSGFTALGGGTRSGNDGLFFYIFQNGHMWSSSTGTNGIHWYNTYNSSNFDSGNTLKNTGYSIRCLKD